MFCLLLVFVLIRVITQPALTWCRSGVFTVANFEHVISGWVHAIPSLTSSELDKNAIMIFSGYFSTLKKITV